MDSYISKILLNSILQLTHDSILFIDSFGIIKLINYKAIELFWEKYVEIVNKSIFNILPELVQIEIILQNPRECEFECVVKSISCKVKLHPIQSIHGECLGILIILQDLSDSIRLRNMENELQDIIEGVADGVYVTDGEGNTLYINKSCSEITGLKREVVMGKNVNQLVQEGIMLESSTVAVLKSRQAESILQKNVNGKTVLVAGKPIFDQKGNIRMVVSSSRNITELNHLKSKFEKERLLSHRYHSELMSLKLNDMKNTIAVQSEKMIKILEIAAHVARSDATILLSGESGVGKDLICRFIHAQSLRDKEPFVKINCAAIPENLLEAELFGYADGAFTGAKKGGKIGIFEIADKGTLFLDEIGEMPVSLQPKLLQVIQERAFLSVGDTRLKTVNVRIIAATNRNLKELVKQGKFRQDLFYRLNVVPITIPSLRERREDIPLLLYHFLTHFNQKYGVNKILSKEVVDVLLAHSWPGNVRELENCIEHSVVIGQDDLITLEHLPAHLRVLGKQPAITVTSIIPWREAVEELERQLIIKAYESAGSTHKAAKLLGVSQPTIVRKLNKIKNG